MLTAIIILAVVCCMLTLAVTFLIGYMFRQYVHDITPQYSHPEMFDENGLPLPDEIIAVRFENTYYLDEFEE